MTNDTIGRVQVQGRRRRRKRLTFDELWERGPVELPPLGDVSPEDANGMKWAYFISVLARTRPLPARVREDPDILASPLARETGWPLRGCRMMVAQMIGMTARQLREEMLDTEEE